jgi:DNA (cytosine-5)-methyltransferase 1
MEKLHRLHRGGAPRVLDLFAGCGGLSLGFEAAGCVIAGAVEIDPVASRSHALNFFRTTTPDKLARRARPRDIRCTGPEELAADFAPDHEPRLAFDIIVGGPPCQAFARVGRAKLREVAAHPQAFRQDARANLYLRYLHYVGALQPLALLVENVPDALNYDGHNIAEEMCEALTEMGYRCGYTLLNAAYYGVPQMRERMFLVAYAEELGAAPAFPRPTHWADLPRGYEGSRRVALRSLAPDLFASGRVWYVAPPAASPDAPPAITAREAIEDLPPITIHLEGRLRRGARRFDRFVPYAEQARLSAYASLMRTWPGFEGRGGVFDHVIRYLPRDYAVFRRMNPGDQYPQARRHATDLLQERIAELEAEGTRVRPHSRLYCDLEASIVPPYDPHKFPNKWRKMEADAPARTLMAHLGKDGYSHIHYDSAQARTISVREAARLQSFPDGFVFAGTMNPAFRQIGEAVPPLLANTLAHAMLAAMGVRAARPPLVQRLVPDGGGVRRDVGTLRGSQETDRIRARVVR